MSETARNLVDRYGELMSEGNADALAELYAADAKLVLFNRVMSGRPEIRHFLNARLASHGGYHVVSVDQFQDAGDVVIWEATVEVEIGFLQTTHVVFLNTEGLIQRHVPGIRGYWGM